MADETNSEPNLLTKVAKAVGNAAGKIAAVTGVDNPEADSSQEGDSGTASPQAKPDVVKRGKLPKKSKSRLPRKEKKALKKAQAKQAAAAGSPTSSAKRATKKKTNK